MLEMVAQAMHSALMDNNAGITQRAWFKIVGLVVCFVMKRYCTLSVAQIDARITFNARPEKLVQVREGVNSVRDYDVYLKISASKFCWLN